MRQRVRSLQVRASTVFRGPTRKGKVSEAMNRMVEFYGESNALPVTFWTLLIQPWFEICFSNAGLIARAQNEASNFP